MSNTTEHPKVFISYSWSGIDHENFVLELATTLRNRGVDAILDKWDLKPGQDKYEFMESMVNDKTVAKVLCICDSVYQKKANARTGGVGTESQIISAELYEKVAQTKFIPVVREYDDEGKPCLPTFFKGRIFVDMSTDERYGEGLDEILRLIYEQPFYQKPGLGPVPTFVKDASSPSVRALGSALRAIKEGKPTRPGLEQLYLNELLSALEGLYVEPTGDDFDEKIYQAIQSTKVLRDELSEFFDTLAMFSGDAPESVTGTLRMLDAIGQKTGRPKHGNAYYPGWVDIYKFAALEWFLLLVSALLRYERWNTLRRVFGYTFIVADAQPEYAAGDFVQFDSYLESLDQHRNRRLKLNRISVTADLLKERCSPEATPFTELLQADLFACMATVVDYERRSKLPRSASVWVPRTAVFVSSAALPIFIRAESLDVREGIRRALGVSDGADMQKRLKAAESLFERRGLSLGHGHIGTNLLDVVNVKALVK